MTWEQTIKEYAKDAFDEGKAEGLQEGLQTGKKENARNNAISLLKKTSLLPEMIADCCGLSVEEVLELKESLQAEAVRT